MTAASGGGHNKHENKLQAAAPAKSKILKDDNNPDRDVLKVYTKSGECGWRCSRFTRENGKDVRGWDAADGEYAETVGDCEAFCNTIPECDGYVWVKNSGQCFTKKGSLTAPRESDDGRGLIAGKCADKIA